MSVTKSGFLVAASLVLPLAQASEEYSICRIASTLPGGETIEFTGFKVKGVNGIYTALHGVNRADKVHAIFHDPQTRRARLELLEVDVARDVALLVPAADSKEALPTGGLGLGVWPAPERLEQQLAGKAATVIGYPLGIDLRTATTELIIRKPAVAQLTELLNPPARRELAQRGSPSNAARMLSLQGPFLPGHSGAPILDSDRAVIGIGIGGLGEGKVGHGWAAPFHEIDLKPVTDPAIRSKLAKLPVHKSVYTFFLVVDDRDRNVPNQVAKIITTVESDDGTPILALRNKPGDELKGELERMKEILEAMRNGQNGKFTAAGEAQRIMKNRLYLPSGTRVKVLTEPEQFDAPALGPKKPQELDQAMNQFYTRVQIEAGAAIGNTLWVPAVAIRRRTNR